MEVEDERAVKKLKFRVQPVAEDEDTVTGEEIIDLAMLEKDCERLENLGLTLTESKEILGTLQQHVLARQTDTFVDERRHCSGCGRRLGLKGHHSIIFRTLFGDATLDSPRLRACFAELRVGIVAYALVHEKDLSHVKTWLLTQVFCILDPCKLRGDDTMDERADQAHGADRWDSGDAYEPYVGRWSRLVARKFVKWLAAPPGGRWLDVGCGTGALTQAALVHAAPGEVVGVDPSETYIASASARIDDPRARFDVGDAQALRATTAAFDVVVSGLVLNFVPQPERAVREMARVARPGGTVAAYVWDYAEGMQMMRYFWDAAGSLDPKARELDEGRRFPLCKPEPLNRLFITAGLEDVRVRAIEVPTYFRDFDDYWSPFLGGQGPAPSYAMSLSNYLKRDNRC